MKKTIFVLISALLMTALCGCGAANSGETSGKGIFYTRTATDEEAFSEVLEHQEAGEEIELDDGDVPLSSQPGIAETPETQEEGWLLVRYAKGENGVAEPLWYRVWSEDGGWSQENLPYEGTGWHPVLSVPEEVQPLG